MGIRTEFSLHSRQVDLLASFAKWQNQTFNKEDAIDSQNQWMALIGEDPRGREGLVQQSIQGVLSYVHQDGFKYIQPHDGPEVVPWGTGISTGFYPEDQLFNLNEDPKELSNIAVEQPTILNRMKKLLKEEIDN